MPPKRAGALPRRFCILLAQRLGAPFAPQCLSGINPLPVSKEQGKPQQIRNLILEIHMRPITTPLTCIYQRGCRDLSQLLAYSHQIPNRTPVNSKPRSIEIRHPRSAVYCASPISRSPKACASGETSPSFATPPVSSQPMGASIQHLNQPNRSVDRCGGAIPRCAQAFCASIRPRGVR